MKKLNLIIAILFCVIFSTCNVHAQEKVTEFENQQKK